MHPFLYKLGQWEARNTIIMGPKENRPSHAWCLCIWQLAWLEDDRQERDMTHLVDQGAAVEDIVHEETFDLLVICKGKHTEKHLLNSN